MNKIQILILFTIALLGTQSFCSSTLFKDQLDWTNFYVGVNAGHLWSVNNVVNGLSLPLYVNSEFSPLSESMSDALQYLSSNQMHYSSSGFFSGLQLGYDLQFSNQWVVGIETDLSEISPAKTSMRIITSQTPLDLGTQFAIIDVDKKLNYLGFIKSRLGYLFKPPIMIYGFAAFAYGSGKMDVSYSITHIQPLFSPIISRVSKTSILSGWGMGAGLEWLLSSHWSINTEYVYYNLGPIETCSIINQNLNTNPVLLLVSTEVKTRAQFKDNALRVSLNYRFG